MNNLPKFPSKCLINIGIGLVIFDLILINYLVLGKLFFAQEKSEPPKTTSYILPSTRPATDTQEETDIFTLDTKLQEATASLTERLTTLEKRLPPQTVTTTTTSGSSVKEYYIPLGSGKSSSQDWVDIPGVEAYVAPSNYGTIKEMYFEASMRIPTGNGRVYVRLKNVTDNYSLVESELSREDTTTGMLSSGKLPTPLTTKLYRVQMKSTLGAEAVLDNARIKIFVK